jgi:ABC-type polysaccharide/polyol phosphate export permease
LIGPFWLTLSMAVMIGTIGIIYGEMFNIDRHDYLPYLTASLLVWGLISSCLSEGCQTFIEANWLIMQGNLPLSMFPFRVIWRNLVVFLHNAVIYLFVAVFFQIEPNWSTLAVVPGLLLLLVNALWCALLLGMLSARFRDLPQIISSLLQVLFFATPIIWRSDLIRTKILVNANPFYHFIELVRAPLLGKTPSTVSWLIAGAITALGVSGTLLFFRRFRTRIAFWV